MLVKVKVVGETSAGFNLWMPCQNHHKQVNEALGRTGGNLVAEIPDPRHLSNEQRMKAHVLIGYIADWYGGTPAEVMKVLLKEMFRGREPSLLEDEFSLSDCSMECARLFITYLVDFCLLYGVDTGVPMYELTEDIPKYVWACLMNHRCAVCGRKNDLHHVSRVGMGRNRNKIVHLGMKVLPLCREHHEEAHRLGDEAFMKKYFLQAVPVDERIAKEYGLRKSENIA